LVLPDAAPAQVDSPVQQQLEPATPQPVVPISQEVTLTDATESIKSTELLLYDPPPPPAANRELFLPDAPVNFFEIEHNHWAEPTISEPELVKKFSNLLVDIDVPDQWKSERAFPEFPSNSTSPQSESSYSSESSSEDHKMSTGKQPQRGPQLGEAGPSQYQPAQAWQDQDDTASHYSFKPTTSFPLHQGGTYPYAPPPWGNRQTSANPWAPTQPTMRDLQMENERLRQAYEKERQMRLDATAAQQHQYQQPAPTIRHSQPQTQQQPLRAEVPLEGLQQSRHAPNNQTTAADDLLQELIRFQMRFANDQMNATGEILRRSNYSSGGTLKAADVGFFEPKSMPDAQAAMHFIDNFNDAVIHYGEDRTKQVLRKCCKNDIARAWVSGLSDPDRIALQQSTWHWERILRRDFMPRPAQLYAQARNETFRWNQNRTPAEYVTHKIRLLRIAGITNDDHVVEELHNGFIRCPEMHLVMEASVKEQGNDIAEYRRTVQRYQDSAKLQYDYMHKNTSTHFNSLSQQTAARRERPAHNPKAITAGTDSEQSANTNLSYPRRDTTFPRKDRRDITRKRKCKNFPRCGDGEHFDWECKIRSSRVESKRAYYITSGEDIVEADDHSDASVQDDEVVLRECDPEIEEEYEQQQNAHFAAVWRAEQGFMGSAVAAENSTKPTKRIPPKPSECRKCRLAFPSRNQLHKHVVATGHNVQTAKQVIESALHTRDGTDLTTLASFHYAKAQFMLAENDRSSSLACIDSGYGNSAVDQEFLESQVLKPVYQTLDSPVVVRGIGGAKVACTQVAIFPAYFPTIDGRLAKITRPYHIFPKLGCELLIGIDTIYLERIDLFFSAAIPQMRLGNCDNAAVAMAVFKKELIRKVLVRASKRTTVPPNSTTIVEVKLARPLPINQDYLFTPNKLRTLAAAGAGAPHGVFAHDQKAVLFTNVNDVAVTIFHNTVLGHVESVQNSHHACWEEASEEVDGYLGILEDPKKATQTTFDPDEDSSMPIPADGDQYPTAPRPRPTVTVTPCVDTTTGTKCADEIWLSPEWLEQVYHPRYEHDLPEGIVVPTVETTTYELVVVNEEDDISPEQVHALRQLIARHPTLFNDGMGCVREPEEDWLRLPVDKEYELKLTTGRPYKVSKQGEKAIDVTFDALTAHGRLEVPKRTSPWGLKVFVVYKSDKDRPVIDMRLLNAALPGDSYPLPKVEDVIEPLNGMRWLGTVDITSAFYQRLLHPDDRYRTAVVTHRGVEQFTTSVMGGKTSVQHQQRLMDKRLIAQLSWRCASCYVDDIVLYAPTFQRFLEATDEVFRILSNLGITLKAKKCFLGFHSIELLGYLVDRLGLTTTDSKSDAVKNIPFPATLAQLEHFIGLTNWNRHLIPYYSQRVAPLQLYKTRLLKGAPVAGRARKQYAARTPVLPDDTLIASFEDLKEVLASRPRIHHVMDGQPIYAFLDSSREYGTGLAVYQLTGDPDKYCKTRLVPLHFMSRKLSAAEANYWPTDMEMSGLVWAVKKLRPYMERAYIWFVTDHKPNVDIFGMKSLVTTSTARSNLRLQTWGIYLSQFRGRMSVLYSKGSKIDCPDALSRLQYEISAKAQALQKWAHDLGKEHDTAEFEVTEAFTMAAEPLDPITEEPNESTDTSSPVISDSTALTISPTAECKSALQKAIQNSSRFAVIRDRLLTAEKTLVDGCERYELPETCQYVLHDGLLYLIDPITRGHRLVLASKELQKKHMVAAHTDAHIRKKKYRVGCVTRPTRFTRSHY
jgi:hypothetical protein